MSLKKIQIVIAASLLVSVAEARTLLFESGPKSAPQSVSAPLNASNAPVPPPPVVPAPMEEPVLVVEPAKNVNSELYFMFEQMALELSTLRGLVEEQAHEIKTLKDSNKSRYADLDSRILELNKKISGGSITAPMPPLTETAPASASSSREKVGNAGSSGGGMSLPEIVPAASSSGSKTPGTKTAVSAADSFSSDAPTDEQKREYQAAYSLITEKQFDQAIDQLHAFIKKYPEGVLAGNAYYWLGEVYLVKPQLEQALQSFMVVVNSFKGHSKVPDALYKLAVTYDRMQDANNSEQFLTRVQKEFPDSTAAKLAKNYRIRR